MADASSASHASNPRIDVTHEPGIRYFWTGPDKQEAEMLIEATRHDAPVGATIMVQSERMIGVP